MTPDFNMYITYLVRDAGDDDGIDAAVVVVLVAVSSHEPFDIVHKNL